MNPPVLILGASSSIARAAAHAFAAKGHPVYLAGRDLLDLERMAADIKVRFRVEACFGYFAAEEYDTHEAFVQRVVRDMQGLGGVLVAFGTYKDHKKAMTDFDCAHQIIDVNFTGTCSILTACANYLGVQGSGFIIAISSVAGDRGRQSNYVYGASKAGLDAYLEGLRNRLFHSGVRVLTIKPGFVDTAMTFGMPQLFLVASPKDVGDKIVDSLNRSRDVVYLPWFWRYIMKIIRLIPEPLFKRLKL